MNETKPALNPDHRIMWPTTDRMCSPPIYATSQMADKMAASSRNRSRSGSTPTSLDSPFFGELSGSPPLGGLADGPPASPAEGGAATKPPPSPRTASVRDCTTVAQSGAGVVSGTVNGAQHPFLIGVAGGTASGKSTVCHKIVEMLGQKDVDQTMRRVDVVSQECFYRELTDKEQLLAEKGQFDFDHPSAFDENLIVKSIEDLKAGRSVTLPQYDYVKNCGNWARARVVHPADVILFEGILVFYFKAVRDAFNMKLFVDTDADTRLSRRVTRDMTERMRSLDAVLSQYVNFVKPAFEEFCLPTKKYADVIIPRGADNIVAIDLIVQHIQELLKPTKPEHQSRAALLPSANNDSLSSFKLLDERDLRYTSAH